MISNAFYMLTTLFLCVIKSKTWILLKANYSSVQAEFKIGQTKNGFRFSKTKTSCGHFSSKRKLQTIYLWCLHIDGNQLKVVKDAKFFKKNSPLYRTFKMLKEKTRYLILFKLLPRCCQLQMSFIHSSSSVSLSCSVEIRDYGYMIYGSARTSYFRALDAIDYIEDFGYA